MEHRTWRTVLGTSAAIWLALGAVASMPAHAQSTPTAGGTTSFQAVYDAFDHPAYIEALHLGDMGYLVAEGPSTFIYVARLVTVVHGPNAYWRYGADIEARLDSSLNLRIEHARLTRPELEHGLVPGALAKSVSQLEQCQLSILSGQSPTLAQLLADYRCVAGGAMAGSKDIGLLRASADLDGRRLMLLATTDPATFLEIYEGLRAYVHNL